MSSLSAWRDIIHKVERTKTFATIFWKHDQKASESEETYVTELKIVCMARPITSMIPPHEMSDLICRFLNGLMDQKACQQVEFVKDPANIDEALDENVRYQESHQFRPVPER